MFLEQNLKRSYEYFTAIDFIGRVYQNGLKHFHLKLSSKPYSFGQKLFLERRFRCFYSFGIALYFRKQENFSGLAHDVKAANPIFCYI